MMGKQLQRPLIGEEFGLSDELWELVQSSLAHEMKERPSVLAFVEFLEEATPNTAVLKKLAKFDVNSEDNIQKLRHIFEYKDNTLFGMREEETLALIEVFDGVNPSFNTFPYLSNTSHFVWFRSSTPR